MNDYIPVDATHYSVVYGKVSYWCIKAYDYSTELCEYRKCWHSWTGTQWQQETSVNTDRLYVLHSK